ncbi:hypothetical protein DWY31_08640 [Dorea sp. AF24-7LB]|nr:hypothetical protein DW125_05760 [Dorea sp. AM10-31]RHQ55037.1 hypothetical protein DWY31_08640 [Dorea sp. AF24-7LB]
MYYFVLCCIVLFSTMMSESKDAIRMYCTSYSRNSVPYSHIIKLTLHFYAHIRDKEKVCYHIMYC